MPEMNFGVRLRIPSGGFSTYPSNLEELGFQDEFYVGMFSVQFSGVSRGYYYHPAGLWIELFEYDSEFTSVRPVLAEWESVSDTAFDVHEDLRPSPSDCKQIHDAMMSMSEAALHQAGDVLMECGVQMDDMTWSQPADGVLIDAVTAWTPGGSVSGGLLNGNVHPADSDKRGFRITHSEAIRLQNRLAKHEKLKKFARDAVQKNQLAMQSIRDLEAQLRKAAYTLRSGSSAEHDSETDRIAAVPAVPRQPVAEPALALNSQSVFRGPAKAR